MPLVDALASRYYAQGEGDKEDAHRDDRDEPTSTRFRQCQCQCHSHYGHIRYEEHLHHDRAIHAHHEELHHRARILDRLAAVVVAYLH
jgi:hypothetical protein